MTDRGWRQVHGKWTARSESEEYGSGCFKTEVGDVLPRGLRMVSRQRTKGARYV